MRPDGGSSRRRPPRRYCAVKLSFGGRTALFIGGHDAPVTFSPLARPASSELSLYVTIFAATSCIEDT